LGEALTVEADIFMDGHDSLRACVAWRAADESSWQEVPMEHLGNDRWRAAFTPLRLGRHVFVVKAWLDVWESYRSGVRKKRDAQADIVLDVREGRALLAEAAHRARREAPEGATFIQKVLEESDEADA